MFAFARLRSRARGFVRSKYFFFLVASVAVWRADRGDDGDGGQRRRRPTTTDGGAEKVLWRWCGGGKNFFFFLTAEAHRGRIFFFAARPTLPLPTLLSRMSGGDAGGATKRKLDQDDASPKRPNLNVRDGDKISATAGTTRPPGFAGHDAATRLGDTIRHEAVNSVNGVTHDPVRGVTYVTDFRDNIHRLGCATDERGGPPGERGGPPGEQSGPKIRVFCHLSELKNAACVPEPHRTPDRALLCWTDTAVYAVSETGDAKLLAGNEGVYGAADGKGGSAIFSGIAGVAFDALGSVIVLADYARRVCRLTFDGDVTPLARSRSDRTTVIPVTKFLSSQPSVAVDCRCNSIYVSGEYREALRRIDGATGAETLVRFARLADGATMRRPRSLLYDPDGDRLFVADGARIWIACLRTRELQVLADLGTWEPDAALALTDDADHRDEKLALALEPDARHAADIATCLVTETCLRGWPPGLADVVLQYARPGLHILVARRSTGEVLRVAVGPRPPDAAGDPVR